MIHAVASVALTIGVVVGPLAAPAFPGPPGMEPNCDNISTGLLPIEDLGTGTYQGLQGGLYPDGLNTMPAGHLADGLDLAEQIGPVDALGNPDPSGAFAFLAVGMSNTEIESDPIIDVLELHAERAAKLVLVNGAKGGRDTDKMSDLTNDYWVGPNGLPGILDDRLMDAGVTAPQVQVIWLKQARAGDEFTTFAEYTAHFEEEMITIIQALRSKFPNLKLMYLSNRSYGGYASTPLNPDPYAYWTGWGDKWLIEAQLAGDPRLNYDPAAGPVVAPWLAWGPTLWADGLVPRSDGLVWVCPDDFLVNGTHPSGIGSEKVAGLMDAFVTSDFTSQQWFFENPPPVLTITGGPENLTNQTSTTFTFGPDDPQATYGCSLDGLPATPCTSPATYSGLSEGAHTFTVVATDADGHVGPPATWQWTIDLTAPQLAPGGIEMFDADRDGKIDRLTVRFTEPIASNPQDLARWTLTDVPSGGSLASVVASGDTVTLTLTEGPAAGDTAVRAFRVALSKGLAGVHDLAGNEASFVAIAPVDRAGPVPVSVWDTDGTEGGRIQPGDTLGFTFSEPLSPPTIPLTSQVTETDPAGPGPDTLSIAGILQGAISLAADGYVKRDGRSVSYEGVMWYGPNVRTIQVTVGTTCTGVCSSLGAGGPATVVFVPSATLTDPAGNAATGTITLVNLAMF
jgi:hypothetical protein